MMGCAEDVDAEYVDAARAAGCKLTVSGSDELCPGGVDDCKDDAKECGGSGDGCDDRKSLNLTNVAKAS